MKWLAMLLRDHRAMQIFRRHFGDMELVAVVDTRRQNGSCYQCRLFQHEWTETADDPSEAILKAYRRWKEEVKQ